MVDPDHGKAFYVASDDGRVFNGPAGRRSPSRTSGSTQAADPLASAVPGEGSAGLKLAAVTLPAHSFTEIEFAVRATVDADWGARYRFRLVGRDPPSCPGSRPSWSWAPSPPWTCRRDSARASPSTIPCRSTSSIR